MDATPAGLFLILMSIFLYIENCVEASTFSDNVIKFLALWALILLVDIRVREKKTYIKLCRFNVLAY